jgi:glycerol-3-phosphate cytidylyltransferase-like family protein
VRLDAVLADPSVVDDEAALERRCARLGARLHVARVSRRRHPGQHDRLRLAAALEDVLASGEPRPPR